MLLTRLQKRPILALSILACVACAILWWGISGLQSQLIESTAIGHARAYSEALQEFRSLYTSEVVSTAKKNGLEVVHDYNTREGAIPLPATMTMLLGKKIGEQQSGAETHLYSPFPFPWRQDTGGLRDDYARDAWASFQDAPNTPFYRFENHGGQDSLRYAVADVMRSSCVQCHNNHADTPKRDWKIGDVRGVLEVTLPLGDAVAQAQARTREILITVMLVVLPGFGLLGLALSTMRRNAGRLERTVDQRTRALAESLGQLELQKNALDEHSLVSITDVSGKITYANDKFCQISQYSREELVGQNHRIVNSGHHPRAFWAKAWKTIVAGKVWHAEVCNRAKDGSLYWVDTTIVPFTDEQGRLTQHIAIRTDITGRKMTEVALKESKEQADAANRAKSEFLANMSHEIRTPMTAILGFAENLLDSDQSESERIDSIHTIRRNGESLLGIINDILDLSKIEAGKMCANRVSCEPCRVVAEVASLIRVQADAKGLTLNIEYDGAIPKTIHTDPTRLRQILINLVGNAIKFTETGVVRLVTRFVDEAEDDLGRRPKEPCLQFDVIDTGRGMTEKETTNLFQPFMQADNSATRKIGGTGLGLTISKRFAELLGGDITIIETELGVGSTFRATVATGSLDGVQMLENSLAATLVEEDASTVTQAPRTDLHGLRILLAEDGPDNQRLISFVLKKAGADVTVEENGKLALDSALASQDGGKPFDLILMDMQMPVMDGYEATGHLRQKGYAGPIIALTAHAMEGDRDKCIKAGCDDYATKPIDRQKLVKLIVEHVQSGRSKPDGGQTETPERPPLRGCRILLAEGNQTNQVLVVGILKKAGAEIIAVKDGKLALDAALAARDDGNPFDIVLMDIQMPLMDGDEATRLLRERGYTGKIISLTADTADEDQQRYIKTGFDDSAWKPINRAKLIETIQKQWIGAEAVPATTT